MVCIGLEPIHCPYLKGRPLETAPEARISKRRPHISVEMSSDIYINFFERCYESVKKYKSIHLYRLAVNADISRGCGDILRESR